MQVLATLFLAETYHPAILAKICKDLKQETGNEQLHTKWQGGPDKTVPALLRKAMVRPFIMLFTQPALQAMAIYRAYGYGIMYLVFSTFPMVFEEQYGMKPSSASLNYISLGVGFAGGLQISGPLQDRVRLTFSPPALLPTTLKQSPLSYTNTKNTTQSTPPPPSAPSTTPSGTTPPPHWTPNQSSP